MKIKDLIRELTSLDPDAVVVLKKDSDFLIYSILTGVREGMFKKTNYGNDFFPNDLLILDKQTEARAVCLLAEGDDEIFLDTPVTDTPTQ